MGKIVLTKDEVNALKAIAEHEKSSAGAVLRKLILREALDRGLLPSLAVKREEEGTESHDER